MRYFISILIFFGLCWYLGYCWDELFDNVKEYNAPIPVEEKTIQTYPVPENSKG